MMDDQEKRQARDYLVDEADMQEACAKTVEAVKGAPQEAASGLSEQELERLTHELVAAIKTVLRSGDSGRYLRAWPDL